VLVTVSAAAVEVGATSFLVGNPPPDCELTPDPSVTGARFPHCRLAALAGGASFSFLVQMDPDGSPVVTPTAMVAGGEQDPDVTNNTATRSLTLPGAASGDSSGGGGADVWLSLLIGLAAFRPRRK
jgi:hypothetical protein